MHKKSAKKISLMIIVIIMSTILPFSVIAAGDDVIMNYYDENRELAAALAIAMIDEQNTELYYLGDTENDPDFVFEWASNTKIMTWVCVMQMVEQGKIDLNADIRTYLPEKFLTLRYNEPITMLNLMNHNAGFQEMSFGLDAEKISELVPLAEALKRYQPPQIRRPGAVVSYSNYGVGLAGYIVERVSGVDYGDYIWNNVFIPLGMEHTSIRPDFSDNDWVASKREHENSYYISEDGKKIGLGVSYSYCNIYPAGSACGTIGDFAKFVNAIMPDEDNQCPLFLNANTLAEMYEPTLYYANGAPRNAHGMWIGQFGNGLFGHGGNCTGFASNFMIDPVAQKAYVVMTNIAGEYTFNHGALPILFGDYMWNGEDFFPTADISGRYIPMREYLPKGFRKFGSSALVGTRIYIARHDNDFVLPNPWTGEDYPIIWVSNNVFYIDNGFAPQHFFLADNGVLQVAADDFHPVSAAGFYLDWTLFILLVLSGLFAIVLLIIKCVIFAVKRVKKEEPDQLPKEKYHLISLGLICSVALFIYLMAAVSLLSEGPDNRAGMTVFGLLATMCAAAAVVFGVLQVKVNNSRLRTKALRVITLVASVAVLANVLFWELYSFWNV